MVERSVKILLSWLSLTKPALSIVPPVFSLDISSTGPYPLVIRQTTAFPSKIAKVQASRQSLSHQLIDRIRQKYRQPTSKRRLRADLLGQAKSSYCTEPISATSLLNFRNLNVYVVGEVGHPKAKIVRIVHISDTRGTHVAQCEQIPQGHILIHSGDFVSSPPSRGPRLPIWCQRFQDRLARLFGLRPQSQTANWRQQVEELNQFFAGQPHDYKIFIPGCWENWRCDPNHHQDTPTPEKIQTILKSAIYLEDAWCRVCGLTIYGTSWTAADDLRSEDGTFAGRDLDRLFRFSRRMRSSAMNAPTEPVASPPIDVSSVLSTTSVFSTNMPPVPSFADDRARGFVLPNILDVAERWKYIPECADIVVTHMPAWRPELFTHIAERVNPTLHLCGHDFTGYGVMWKRGTLFSNAALQLTDTFPPTGCPKPDPTTVSTSTVNRHPGRKRARSRTVSHDEKPNFQSTRITSESLTPPLLISEPVELRGSIREPPLYTRKPNGRPRPPRWQRRLPYALSRLFFGSGGDGGRGSKAARSQGCAAHWSALFRRRWDPKPTVFISETQSSRAAAEHAGGDLGFIYDPDMRAGIGAMAIADSAGGSGSGAGYSGGSTGLTGSTLCSSMCRRNPIVIDVYVVSDDPDLVILPPYARPMNPSPSPGLSQHVHCPPSSTSRQPDTMSGTTDRT